MLPHPHIAPQSLLGCGQFVWTAQTPPSLRAWLLDLVIKLCMNQVQNLLDTQAECWHMLVPSGYNIHLMSLMLERYSYVTGIKLQYSCISYGVASWAMWSKKYSCLYYWINKEHLDVTKAGGGSQPEDDATKVTHFLLNQPQLCMVTSVGSQCLLHCGNQMMCTQVQPILILFATVRIKSSPWQLSVSYINMSLECFLNCFPITTRGVHRTPTRHKCLWDNYSSSADSATPRDWLHHINIPCIEHEAIENRVWAYWQRRRLCILITSQVEGYK